MKQVLLKEHGSVTSGPFGKFWQTDQQTNWPTDRPTNRRTNRIIGKLLSNKEKIMSCNWFFYPPSSILSIILLLQRNPASATYWRAVQSAHSCSQTTLWGTYILHNSQPILVLRQLFEVGANNNQPIFVLRQLCEVRTIKLGHSRYQQSYTNSGQKQNDNRSFQKRKKWFLGLFYNYRS